MLLDIKWRTTHEVSYWVGSQLVRYPSLDCRLSPFLRPPSLHFPPVRTEGDRGILMSLGIAPKDVRDPRSLTFNFVE